MTINKLVELITNAIAFKYPKDQTRPGLTISLLNNNMYYVSIARYNIEGKEKLVVHKTQASTLENALYILATQLVQDIDPKSPLEILARHVYDKTWRSNYHDGSVGDENVF